MTENLLHHKKRIITGFAILTLATCPALNVYAAASTDVARPNSGTVLESNKPPVTQQPGTQAPAIIVEGQEPSAQVSGGEKIKVSGFHIVGQLPVPEEELLKVITSEAYKELTLTDLNNLAGKITKHLRQHGYIVASAYIPAQAVKDGTVEIAVVVGQYGKIDVRNHSTLKNAVVENLLKSLKSGDYIKADKLDRTLLLMSDISGIIAKATLTPGTALGTSDLVVDIRDAAKTNGEVYVDNWGNRYTGANQLGLDMNVNNLSGDGDMLNLGGTYTGSGMNDYNLTYLVATGGDGAKFGIVYSQMHYLLGDEFAALNANGIAKTTSLFESYAITRTRDFNLNAKVEFDNKVLIDRIDSTGSDSEKRAEVWIAGLSGDSRDKFGGANNFGLTYEKGYMGMDSADAVTNDAEALTAGSYSKTNLNFSRLQAIDSRLNLYTSFIGQLSGKNLDSSEKLQIGGPTGVRAYPVGEAPSDEGYIFTGEFRWNLPTPSFQLVAFYDNGKAILNKNPWAGAGVNNRVLAGAGLGFIWSPAKGYSINLDYAWEITTNDPATAAPNDNGRLWLQATKYF